MRPRVYETHLQAGGKMLVTLAGAMSTAELGISLARNDPPRQGACHRLPRARTSRRISSTSWAHDYL
ncbi:MAG: hypothetical protein WDM96_15895 [Lacunisphaera sp.]